MPILESVLAQKFIDKVASGLEYNINIMNHKGIIIASKDSSRIGDFHEVASSMLKGTIKTGVVNEKQKYLGTKPGVNLFVDYNNKHVGVICVTGEPKDVDSFAELVKNSLEAMLEYEFQMKRERNIRNKSEEFLYYLLFKKDMNSITSNKIAEELRFNKDIVRVCILIKHSSNKSPRKIVKMLTKLRGYSTNDIITIARNDDIIILKSIGEGFSKDIKYFRYVIEEFYNEFVEAMVKEHDKENINFFVGSLQNNINKYKTSYKHAHELELQVKSINNIYFFNDYIVDYYRSLVTIKEYDDIFNLYAELFTKEEKEQLIEMVEVLFANNYNVASSSKMLFIHRNTLLFRLDKLKEKLNIDPITNYKDREFINEFVYYCSRKQVD